MKTRIGRNNAFENGAALSGSKQKRLAAPERIWTLLPKVNSTSESNVETTSTQIAASIISYIYIPLPLHIWRAKKGKKVPRTTVQGTFNSGSPCWARTNDPAVNSFIDEVSTVSPLSIFPDFTGFFGRCGNNGIVKCPLLTHSPKKLMSKVMSENDSIPSSRTNDILIFNLWDCSTPLCST